MLSPRAFTLVILMVRGGGLWVAVSDAFVGSLIWVGEDVVWLEGNGTNVGSDREIVFSFVYNSNCSYPGYVSRSDVGVL